MPTSTFLLPRRVEWPASDKGIREPKEQSRLLEGLSSRILLMALTAALRSRQKRKPAVAGDPPDGYDRRPSVEHLEVEVHLFRRRRELLPQPGLQEPGEATAACQHPLPSKVRVPSRNFTFHSLRHSNGFQISLGVPSNSTMYYVLSAALSRRVDGIGGGKTFRTRAFKLRPRRQVGSPVGAAASSYATEFNRPHREESRPAQSKCKTSTS